ncbi:MAG: serine/threonine protein kinase [Thermoanaerobaculia bacterium]
MPAELQRAEDVARNIAKEQDLALVGLRGEGAFKHTFEVANSNGEVFALKLFKSADVTERTAREVAAMKRCRHPNIARLLAIGNFIDSGESFVFSIEEFLAGGSLGERLTKQLMSDNEFYPIGIQLADALAHDAALDLVHRDIKPDNIMFRNEGPTPVIVDFGLVRDLNAPSVTASFAMRGPGTPYFASPEQLNNEKQMIDWRADQFGLGVTFFYALTGRHPYQHDGDTPADVVGCCRAEGTRG